MPEKRRTSRLWSRATRQTTRSGIRVTNYTHTAALKATGLRTPQDTARRCKSTLYVTVVPQNIDRRRRPIYILWYYGGPYLPMPPELIHSPRSSLFPQNIHSIPRIDRSFPLKLTPSPRSHSSLESGGRRLKQ